MGKAALRGEGALLVEPGGVVWDEITRAAEAMRDAELAYRQRQAEWGDAIRAAYEAGYSMREIAEHAGVTRQRVQQIVHRRAR